MPLDDIGSYSPLMDQFYAHWEDVNIALRGTAATDLTLAGGFTRALFLALRAEIQARITALDGLENGRQILGTNRDTIKAALRERLAQFRGMLRAVLPQSKYASAAPVLPDPSAAESKFLAPFDDAADLWGRIDADASIAGFVPPLVIAGYTRAAFVAEIAALRAVFTALTTAENDLRLGQGERDLLLPVARERMVQYRSAVPALLGPTHPLTTTLPDLYPQPGSTPDPVTLSGTYNAGTAQADFHWTASAAPTLLEYEVRRSPGATYSDATATVVSNLLPGTTTFATAAGLDASGDSASFKVFVRLTTGNVAGSNSVTITRP